MHHILDMDVGLALPTMASEWSRSTWIDWCRIIDDGPFSSISCGERITFRNVEMLTTLAAAAALTERPRVMVNLAIAPWHATMLLAKQLATLDVVSGGRLDVGLGVGGRGQDYEGMGASLTGRHARLDEQVAEMRRLWAGEPPPIDRAPPLGPPVVQPGGPPLYVGATGPKALRRAAAWAAGVSGFSFSLDPAEIVRSASDAREAWADVHGREADAPRPRFLVGCFFVLDDDEQIASDGLRQFTYDYLEVFSRSYARGQSEQMTLSSGAGLRAALDAVAATGVVDEVILVPGSTDPRCAELAADVVSSCD